jgi:pimeloyl-ACP methyl ester carboxylesterase
MRVNCTNRPRETLSAVSEAVAAALVLSLFGCTAVPVRVTRVGPRNGYRDLTANALSVDKPSIYTRNVLQRRNLLKQYAKEPEKALASLHEFALKDGDMDTYFALAELSFLRAEKTRDRSWYLATAVYAWSALFGGDPPGSFDPRLRAASDLYNRGLTSGLASEDGETVDLRGGTFSLPFGTLKIAFDENTLDWNGRNLRRFVPADELEVHGLNSRFRTAGIGAPLAADASAEDPDSSREFLAPRLNVPVTALLWIDDVRRQIAAGSVRGTLKLYTDPDPQMINLAGLQVPLERDDTATSAAMLGELPIWSRELSRFRGALKGQVGEPGLVALRPHRFGRIPVVFVHGTNSHPARWAEMVNVLDNDPRIHARFEPWFFLYNSGSPILYSSYLLRKALSDTVEQIDPTGKDSCLRDMVVVGHSQGGLLAKMTAVDSGDRFWRNLSDRPIDSLRVNEEDRALIRDAMVVKPLPFVKSVIFIATPHRGSFHLALRLGIRQLFASFISLPERVSEVTREALAANPDAFIVHDIEPTTALDNLTPGNRFIDTLADLPIAPGAKAHSIIAVKGDGPIESGDDGVVEYSSAHIDGVESEKVVRSGHTTQGEADTIEEVRRILLEHAAGAPPDCGVS